MISNFKRIARRAFRKVLGALLPELRNIEAIGSLQGVWDSEVSEYATISPFCKVSNSSIEAYTYVSEGTILNRVDIGRYGSIGPYVIAGWGLHPTNGISTCPMFYSFLGQNGQSFSKGNNFDERRRITIGHDVFIGMKACILDGVKIGNGAVVAAGAVVNRDVPPYAVVGGVPAKILKYRFSPEVISRLLNLEWYLSPNPDGIHKIVAEHFYDPYGFFEALTVLEQENSCSGQ